MRTISLGKLVTGIIAVSSIFGSFVAAQAQDRSSQIRSQLRDRMNANTITIASGNPNGAYLFLGYDMTAVLDKEDGLRVLAYIGKGGQQNVKDALFLRGVDLAITQANVLRYYKKTGELGGDIDRRLVYITRLNLEEMHLVVAENSGINSIQDLAGKTVNFSDAGSGTQLSTQILFQTLKMNVKEVNMGQGDALEKLKTGEIAGTFLVAGKPSGAFGKLTPGSGYKILPLAFTPEMEAADFLPTQLTNKDYPMIPAGQTVDTLAVSAVLAAFNWPSDTDRYRRTAAFIEQFFDRIGEFQKPPRHPKWKEVNIAANLPGWVRHPAAQAWIDRHRTTTAATR